MKFLCVPCDQPMALAEVVPPDRGSLAVRYACPACGYEIAMLTNPYETQVVASLGVRIGTAALEKGEQGSACPFTAMLGGTSDGSEGEEPSATAPTGGAVISGAAASVAPSLTWTPEAEARLANIPPFVRPMARSGIERFARERGCEHVDERVLDEAREFFGM